MAGSTQPLFFFLRCFTMHFNEFSCFFATKMITEQWQCLFENPGYEDLASQKLHFKMFNFQILHSVSLGSGVRQCPFITSISIVVGNCFKNHIFLETHIQQCTFIQSNCILFDKKIKYICK